MNTNVKKEQKKMSASYFWENAKNFINQKDLCKPVAKETTAQQDLAKKQLDKQTARQTAFS